MKAQSVAWPLMAMGVAAVLALGVLVVHSTDLFEVSLMAANGDLDLLIRLAKWRSEARLALAVLSIVALVLCSAPLWLVRRTAASAAATQPVAQES